jgi:hypothetical protein
VYSIKYKDLGNVVTTIEINLPKRRIILIGNRYTIMATTIDVPINGKRSTLGI